VNVTLADIQIGYIATFGQDMPDTMSFAEAGERVKDAWPSRWQDIFAMSEKLRDGRAVGKIEQRAIAALVSERLLLA